MEIFVLKLGSAVSKRLASFKGPKGEKIPPSLQNALQNHTSKTHKCV